MRIVHVIASLAPRFGGPSKACFEMARAVAARGHDVTILTTNMDGPDDMAVPNDRPVVRDGVTLRYFPVSFPRFWKTSWPLAEALREEIPGADVVHLHSLYLFHDWVAGALCQRFGVPYLVRPHGTLDPYIYRRHRLRKSVMEVLFQNRVLKRATAIHYTTREEMRLAEPYAQGAPGIVVANGLDIAEYENPPPRGSFRAKHPEIGERKVVIFFGRINFKKGLDVLAEAFGQAAAGRDDMHLVIAGPDDDGLGAKVRKWLADAGVSKRVTFTGMLEGAEKLAALNDSELFVLPSYSENFGIAVVEAMASGLPVLISDRVNIWREVDAASAGEVIPPQAAPFAEALVSMLADEDELRRMGLNGRTLVREKYQWRQIAARLEEVYVDMRKGQRPS